MLTCIQLTGSHSTRGQEISPGWIWGAVEGMEGDCTPVRSSRACALDLVSDICHFPTPRYPKVTRVVIHRRIDHFFFGFQCMAA